ncbi:uncharacterized protein LOC141904499 [Tubulanus polymorphus]|uniref:uncharacterized protein LOC141904499 n=1 Tax=Tubulanus polymorphus TaxID=672921 RepID=UPI003DA419B5
MTGLLVAVISLLGICHMSVAWKNQWDRPLNFQCPNNQHIQWFKSRHDNGREDRLFDMNCRPGYVGTDCSWTGYLNDWDKLVNFVCPHNGIVTGFHSYHDNHREDRRWKLRCCKVARPGQSCYWSGWLADWDQEIDYSFPNGMAMTGMKSIHDNGREDRLFEFRMCFYDYLYVLLACFSILYVTYTKTKANDIRKTRSSKLLMTGLLVVVISLLGICHSLAWKNSWHQPPSFQCPRYQHIQWFKSLDDNGREDRLFDMSCRSGYVGNCSWSSYLNDWDRVVSFVCPHNGIVTGFYSYHDNGKRTDDGSCDIAKLPNLDSRVTGLAGSLTGLRKSTSVSLTEWQ